MRSGLSAQAYRDIRAMIFEGSIAMGERLRETHLAERLGISRTPIREALQQLASEGLAEVDPEQGYRATVYSAERLAEIYGCRALLESESVRLSAQAGLSLDTLEILAGAIDACEEILASGQDEANIRQAFLEQNNIYHATIHAACPNGLLRRLIGEVADIPMPIRNYVRFTDAELGASHRAHKQILRAMAARDGERAAALMREHIWDARDRMDPSAFCLKLRKSTGSPAEAATKDPAIRNSAIRRGGAKRDETKRIKKERAA